MKCSGGEAPAGEVGFRSTGSVSASRKGGGNTEALRIIAERRRTDQGTRSAARRGRSTKDLRYRTEGKLHLYRPSQGTVVYGDVLSVIVFRSLAHCVHSVCSIPHAPFRKLRLRFAPLKMTAKGNATLGESRAITAKQTAKIARGGFPAAQDDGERDVRGRGGAWHEPVGTGVLDCPFHKR